TQPDSGTSQPGGSTSEETIGADPISPGTGGGSSSGPSQQSPAGSTSSTSLPGQSSSSTGQSSLPGGNNEPPSKPSASQKSTSGGTIIPAGSSSRSNPTATPGTDSSSPSKRSKRSESDANSVIVATNRRQDDETEVPSPMKRRRSQDAESSDPDDEYSSDAHSRRGRDWPRERRRDEDSRQDVMSYPRNGIAVWTGAAGRSQRVTVYGFPGIPISVNRPAVRGGHARMITPPSPSNGWKYAVVEFERGEGTCEVAIPWQKL
ncbi:MAG TPA: hypothetical protein PLL06_17485, partial [Acidobacteriota bacterium]|nr:hypothetical protein [Acidobacteriota bacterium]